MADVRPQDILLRLGGGTLRRLQTLCAAGAGRGVEVPYTFTRATVRRAFRDRDGNAKRAAAASMGIEWPSGLVDASGNAIGGPLIEGARTQLVPDPENFGAWTVSNTPVLTSGQADPFGGTLAYQINDDDGALLEHLYEIVTFTGNATKAFSIFLKAGTAASTTLDVFDTGASAKRVRIDATWAAGVPTLSIPEGAGATWGPFAVGGGWYWIPFSATGVLAAGPNRLRLMPAGNTAGNTGTTFCFGANAWNSPFPTSYQSPSEATGVADALPAPFNWGPSSDITVLARLGRPFHADASGALGVSPGIFSFGAGAAARIGAYFDPAARNIISVIDTATTDATQTTAIPAGNPTICIQYKNLTTGGQTALDAGSGMTAFSSAATGFSAFSSQTLRIGRYDDELYGVLGDMVIARGLFTMSEMLAIS